jgi:flagellar biosynthesis anti-sigma factor FlgM
MRINPQIPPVDSTAATPVNDSRTNAAKTAQPSPVGEPSDTVRLSSGQATVRQLVTQLDQVPEIRQQKVSSLRSQVQSGQFQRSNQQVAGAIVDDLFGAVTSA